MSLRNQDLHMRAQPKQPRNLQPQKRDRLQDVPLTQEWLASSGEMTSHVEPPASGQRKRRPKVLFRDQEQVWAKVRRVTLPVPAPILHHAVSSLVMLSPVVGQGQPVVARSYLP